MYKILRASNYELNDTTYFLALLGNLPSELQGFFISEPEIIVTRAPGRLDLMGGIADYSGSLVLQLPIAASTHAALQIRKDRIIHIISLGSGKDTALRSFKIDMDEFGKDAKLFDYQTVRKLFANDNSQQWAAYVAGAFPVLMKECGIAFQQGANILIQSNVPEGKGVSSSAALEVSVMQAISVAYGISLSTLELAFLCQKVENLIAGAPCGVMDQMTSSCGEADQLLALLCQPGELQEPIKLPSELAVWGIDSGIRHTVSGADYGTVRTAAFMGYRIISALAGLPCQSITPGRVNIEDSRWRGYLANISPNEFDEKYAPHLPEQMSGAEFLARYQGITDPVTAVEPGRIYPILQATRHPIYENARVQSFAAILRNWQGDSGAEQLGEKMFESHASYSTCGLGSEGTDEIVRSVREAGPESGLFGAKITGGGSGGTVAVLGRSDADEAVRKIAAQYMERTGYSSMIISGSSPGAMAFGHFKLLKENYS